MRRPLGGLVAATAGAVDGVVEINQASALAGGITACDTPGFPVSICTSGAYRLTSNLDYPSASVSAIGVGGRRVDRSEWHDDRRNEYVHDLAARLGDELHSTSEHGGLAGVHSNRPCPTVASRAPRSGHHALEASVLRDVQVTDCGENGITLLTLRAEWTSRSSGTGTRDRRRRRVRISGAVATSNGTDGIVAGRARSSRTWWSRGMRPGNLRIQGCQPKPILRDPERGRRGGVFDGGLVESGSIRYNSELNANRVRTGGQRRCRLSRRRDHWSGRRQQRHRLRHGQSRRQFLSGRRCPP